MANKEWFPTCGHRERTRSEWLKLFPDSTADDPLFESNDRPIKPKKVKKVEEMEDELIDAEENFRFFLE